MCVINCLGILITLGSIIGLIVLAPQVYYEKMFETKYRIKYRAGIFSDYQDKDVYIVERRTWFIWSLLAMYHTLEEAKSCIKREIEESNRPKDKIIEVDVKLTADVTEIL